MASVHLEDTWLNLVSDPSQAVLLLRAASSWSLQEVNGEVRQYAGGRLRVIGSSGRPGRTVIKVRTKDMALINTLISWTGQPVWVRDERGRRVTGVYFAVPQVDDVSDWVEFDLAITHTTHDESV